jgi:hypothetical protein
MLLFPPMKFPDKHVSRSRQKGSMGQPTLARHLERLHVKNVDALHLSEKLQALNTRGLFQFGGDGAGRGARTEEIVGSLDLCLKRSVSWLVGELGGHERIWGGQQTFQRPERLHLCLGRVGPRIAWN